MAATTLTPLRVLLVVSSTVDGLNEADEPLSTDRNAFQQQILGCVNGSACGADGSWAGLALPPLAITQVRFPFNEPLPPVAEVVKTTDAIVMSGSKLMVTDNDPWTVELMAWLWEVVKHNEEGQGSSGRHKPVPILGICFGHQVLCQALGGKVDYNPKGRSFGTYELSVSDGTEVAAARSSDPVFGQLPPSFVAQVSHAQVAVSLPPPCSDLKPLAFYRHRNDDHQAVRYGRYEYGLQFHPEFTPEYMELLRRHRGDDSTFDDGKLPTTTPVSTSIVVQFLAWCAKLQTK